MVGDLGAMVQRSFGVSLVSTMVLLRKCFGLTVYRVYQSVFREAPVVTTRIKHTIRLIGSKESM